MDIFLKAKAWQVFLLIVAVPFGVQFSLMGFLVSSIQTNPELAFKIMPIIMLLFMAIFLLWLWSLGVGLNKHIPEEIRPKLTFFKFGIIYSAAYMVLFQVLFIDFSTSGEGGSFMAIILPLHLFAMYCMFYGLYFVSKNLVTYEELQPVKFSSFSEPFFLLWFFPIGIWFIQPRINKVYATKHAQQIN